VISIVLPTKNEPAIEKVMEEINKIKIDKEILVIDNSEDDTALKAKKLGAKVIYQKSNGYGDALVQGFKFAKGEVIVMMDADSTYNPSFIPKLVEPILNNEADIVLGKRNMTLKNMSFSNIFGNKVLTLILNTLYRMNINDSQTGMRAIKKSSLEKLQMYSPGMPLASEMLIEAIKNNLRIAEIPIEYSERVGNSKQKKIYGFYILGTTVRLIRDYNPLSLFGYVGGIIFFLGAVIGADTFWNFLVYGTLTTPGRAILSSMFIMLGLFSIGYGLMIDILIKELKKR